MDFLDWWFLSKLSNKDEKITNKSLLSQIIILILGGIFYITILYFSIKFVIWIVTF